MYTDVYTYVLVYDHHYYYICTQMYTHMS